MQPNKYRGNDKTNDANEAAILEEHSEQELREVAHASESKDIAASPDSQGKKPQSSTVFLNPNIDGPTPKEIRVEVANQSKLIAANLCSIDDIIKVVKTTPVIDPQVESQVVGSHGRRARYNETLVDLQRYRELSSLKKERGQKGELTEDAEVMAKLQEAALNFPDTSFVPEDEALSLDKLLQEYQERTAENKTVHDSRIQSIVRSARQKALKFRKGEQVDGDTMRNEPKRKRNQEEEKEDISRGGVAAGHGEPTVNSVALAPSMLARDFGSSDTQKVEETAPYSPPKPGQIQEDLLNDWSFDKFMAHVSTIVACENDEQDIPTKSHTQRTQNGNDSNPAHARENGNFQSRTDQSTCADKKAREPLHPLASTASNLDDCTILMDIMSAEAAYLRGMSQANFARCFEECGKIVQNYMNKRDRGEPISQVQRTFICQLPELYTRIKEHSSQ